MESTSGKALKALKDIITELNKIVETIRQENINLIKENKDIQIKNNILNEKIKKINEIISV